ncbi:MAG: prepilin-type N-terminal cleavage/methylation domain-containing protein [Verrucomicrobia bacterium]|nr:prepilin-type N-terminal cleavage/methylation domain-containing protein [Verrucomicrobiota bacterium]
MMEMTTKSSTKVKADPFVFGIFFTGGIFEIMTANVAHWSWKTNLSKSFTLVELMAVIAVIGILAGLTLGAAGAVRTQSNNSRAKSEIAALQAACERYFAERNEYPEATSPDPTSPKDCDPNSASYSAAGKVLFKGLFGINQFNLPPTDKRYFEPKASMVSSTNKSDPYFIDPWGYPYGYNSDRTNAPLIWSTANQKTALQTNRWITSWPKM